jgi:leukotriene-A4 hydrolase
MYLDMQGININSVHDLFGEYFDYDIKTPQPALGDQLHIFFRTPLNRGRVIDIVIDYSTTQQQTATSWLEKGQTAGKLFPFMFTQCESIYCRSIVPIQDTPSVKFTYEIQINTPRAIQAKVSGNRTREVFVDDQR